MYVCIYIYAILSPTAYYSSKINLKSCKFLMFFTRAQPGDQGGRQDFGFWRWPADGQGKNLGSPPKKSVIELNLTGKLLVKHCEIMTNVGWLESKKKDGAFIRNTWKIISNQNRNWLWEVLHAANKLGVTTSYLQIGLDQTGGSRFDSLGFR